MTKKLHITLDLPDDVAARMRESFIGDRLKFETRRSIEDLPLTREKRSRFPQVVTVLLLLGLFGTGAVTGYVTAAGYLAFLEFAERLTPTSVPVPGRTASARQQTQVTPAPAPMTGAPQPQSVTLAPPSALSPHTPSASPIRSSGDSGGSHEGIVFYHLSRPGGCVPVSAERGRFGQGVAESRLQSVHEPEGRSSSGAGWCVLRQEGCRSAGQGTQGEAIWCLRRSRSGIAS